MSFEELVVRGDTESRYVLEIACTISGLPSSARIPLPTYVGSCLPGSALSGERVCELCREDLYSPDGRLCLPCPFGASCSIDDPRLDSGGVVTANNTGGEILAKVGPALPLTTVGFWLHERRQQGMQSACEAYEEAKDTCKTGEERSASTGECVPSSLPAEVVHQCVTGSHFYECVCAACATSASVA